MSCAASCSSSVTDAEGATAAGRSEVDGFAEGGGQVGFSEGLRHRLWGGGGGFMSGGLLVGVTPASLRSLCVCFQQFVCFCYIMLFTVHVNVF